MNSRERYLCALTFQGPDRVPLMHRTLPGAFRVHGCHLEKRGINGVYHAVSPKYLQSYLNEYTFRYSHRDDEQPMFMTMLRRVKAVSH